MELEQIAGKCDSHRTSRGLRVVRPACLRVGEFVDMDAIQVFRSVDRMAGWLGRERWLVHRRTKHSVPLVYANLRRNPLRFLAFQLYILAIIPYP